MLQNEVSWRTLTHVRAHSVATDVRTRSRRFLALIHVPTRHAVLTELVTAVAGTMVAARLVHALVLTVVRPVCLDTLVYI